MARLPWGVPNILHPLVNQRGSGPLRGDGGLVEQPAQHLDLAGHPAALPQRPGQPDERLPYGEPPRAAAAETVVEPIEKPPAMNRAVAGAHW